MRSIINKCNKNIYKQNKAMGMDKNNKVNNAESTAFLGFLFFIFYLNIFDHN